MVYTYPHTRLEALRSKIAAVTMDEIRITVIEDEIDLLNKTQ